MKRAALAIPIFFLGLGGCGMRGEIISRETETSFRDSELRAKETRTLTNLAHLETSVAQFYGKEGRVPRNLSELVPEYIAEIPTAETGIPPHRETARVRIYPAETLKNGEVDGSHISDGGGWGYVFNGRQLVIFVDCTHKRRVGGPWYKARGVY